MNESERCEALLRELFAQDQFAIKLGAEAMAEAARLEGLGRCARVTVHIAGTNGKGTTSAALTALCHAAGLKTGLYTSPHLVSFRERIRVGTLPISERALAALLDPLLTRFAGRRCAAEGMRPLTYFELATLAAWRHFADSQLDVAIIETGLGGRLDATNTIPKDLTAITNIALDHEAFLGTSVEAIAAEKYGITRAGLPLFLHEAAQGVGAVAACAAADDRPVEWVAGGATARDQNLALAAALFVCVAERLQLSPDAVQRAKSVGLAALRWPGRQQWLEEGGRALLVDGAHNRNGVEACAAWLAAIGEGGSAPRTAIVGLTADRDPAAILAPLRPFVSRWIAVAADNPKAMPAADLATRLAEFGPVEVAAGGIEDALHRSRPDDTLIVGSLYLVGDLFAALGFTAESLRIYDAS